MLTQSGLDRVLDLAGAVRALATLTSSGSLSAPHGVWAKVRCPDVHPEVTHKPAGRAVQDAGVDVQLKDTTLKPSATADLHAEHELASVDVGLESMLKQRPGVCPLLHANVA